MAVGGILFESLDELLAGAHRLGANGLFNQIYADSGRASIAPEKLLRAMRIQVLFSVRSERQLMEQVRYNRYCGLVSEAGIRQY
jgi:hypothetical protein